MTISNTEYFGIDADAIPPTGSKHRLMLDPYMNGKTILEDELCNKFGRNYRGIFQALRGDKYEHWRFIDIFDENGIIVARQIDERHLSKSYEQDRLARAERKKELKEDSFREAVAGANRVKPSYEELTEATSNLNELQTTNTLQSENKPPL